MTVPVTSWLSFLKKPRPTNPTSSAAVFDGPTQLDEFTQGKRSMDARNRKVEQQNRKLWVLTFVMGGAVLLSTTTNLRYSGKSLYIPYVVPMDARGHIFDPKFLDVTNPSANVAQNPFLIRSTIEEFIGNWRYVTTDLISLKTSVDRVYALFDDNSEVATVVTNWYRSHDPVERAKKVHVEASGVTAVPDSANTYNVYWQEEETNLTSSEKKKTYWRAKIVLAFRPVTSQEEAQRNRFGGIWVTNVTEPIEETSHE
jgi:type IV secretory pathway TrbF-like protein